MVTLGDAEASARELANARSEGCQNASRSRRHQKRSGQIEKTCHKSASISIKLFSWRNITPAVDLMTAPLHARTATQQDRQDRSKYGRREKRRGGLIAASAAPALEFRDFHPLGHCNGLRRRRIFFLIVCLFLLPVQRVHTDEEDQHSLIPAPAR